MYLKRFENFSEDEWYTPKEKRVSEEEFEEIFTHIFYCFEDMIDDGKIKILKGSLIADDNELIINRIQKKRPFNTLVGNLHDAIFIKAHVTNDNIEDFDNCLLSLSKRMGILGFDFNKDEIKVSNKKRVDVTYWKK
jgi:hypothetical protein